MSENKKILIIGGTGFLGSKVVDYLERENYEVSILSRGINKQNKRYNSYTCDIARGGITLEEAIEESDVVIHCAGKVSYNPRDVGRLYRIHVDGTRNIVKLCNDKNKSMIYTSSAAVLGISNNPLGNIEEQLPSHEEIEHL